MKESRRKHSAEFKTKVVLEALNERSTTTELADWKLFAPILDMVFNKPKNSSNNVGRLSFDRLMMFKIIILQSLYNLPCEWVKWNTRLPIV